MKLYGKRFVRNKMQKQTERKVESRDAVLWDVDLTNRTCRVKIQGTDVYVTVNFPQNWNVTPTWLKPGNAVRICHKGGINGNMDIIGHGMAIPTAAQGATSIIPPATVPTDVITSGLSLMEIESSGMAVLVKIGAVRISNVNYTVGPITMDNTAYIMDYGGKMDYVAGALAISAAPTVGNFRYDMVVIGADLVFDYVQGSPSTAPVMPAVPSGHLKCGHILVPGGVTEIKQSLINATYKAPVINSITMTIADTELSWAELSTTVTIRFYDQYGNLVSSGAGSGYYTTLKIMTGNGSVSSDEEGSNSTQIGQHAGGSGTSCIFTYTRGQTSSDKTPLLQASVAGTSLYISASITLLDSDGNPMY